MFGYLDSVWQLPVLYRTPGQKRMTKYAVTGPKSQEIFGVGFAWVRSLAVLEDSLGRTPASERGIETGNPTAATRAQAEVSLFNCFTPTSPGRAPTCTHTPASVSPAINSAATAHTQCVTDAVPQFPYLGNKEGTKTYLVGLS